MVEQIQNTKHFQSIKDKNVQAIILNHDFRKKIDHGINVTKFANFDCWVKTSNPAYHLKEIVRELTLSEIEVEYSEP